MGHRSGLRASHLLRALPGSELAHVEAGAVIETFGPGDLLAAGSSTGFVLFPLTAVFAMIAPDPGGGGVSVGSLGPEGAHGVADAFGAPAHALELLCAVGGTAARIRGAEVVRLVDAAPAFRRQVIRYLGAREVIVSQVAACSRFHPLEARLARMLLAAHDRADGRPIAMTQERLALLIGVSRPKVSAAMDNLRRAGLVDTQPGSISAVDAQGLRDRACSCYEVIRDTLGALRTSAPAGD